VIKDLGIKGRVLMLTLLPTSLLALVLGGYFTWVQLSGLQGQLVQRGEMIIEQLAPLAAPALNSGDRDVLQRIANQALEQPDVRAVSFLASERSPLAHAGPSMLNSLPSVSQQQPAQSSNPDATRFLLPVYEQHLSLTGQATDKPGSQLLGWVGVGAVAPQHLAQRIPQSAGQPAADCHRLDGHRSAGGAHEPHHQRAVAANQTQRRPA